MGRHKQEDEFLYGYKIGVKRKLTDLQYINMVYEANKALFEEFYQKDLARTSRLDPSGLSTERFITKKGKNGYEYFKFNVDVWKRTDHLTTNKAVKAAIYNKYVGKADIAVENFMRGLHNYFPATFDALTRLIEAEGEAYNVRRVSYSGGEGGDALYVYTCKSGQQFLISMMNSPQSAEIYIGGSIDSEPLYSSGAGDHAGLGE